MPTCRCRDRSRGSKESTSNRPRGLLREDSDRRPSTPRRSEQGPARKVTGLQFHLGPKPHSPTRRSGPQDSRLGTSRQTRRHSSPWRRTKLARKSAANHKPVNSSVGTPPGTSCPCGGSRWSNMPRQSMLGCHPRRAQHSRHYHHNPCHRSFPAAGQVEDVRAGVREVHARVPKEVPESSHVC